MKRPKVCVIPKQNDISSCGIIVMMAIYQIYIQGNYFKNSILFQISQTFDIYFSTHYLKQLKQI